MPQHTSKRDIGDRIFKFVCQVVLLVERLLDRGPVARTFGGQLLRSAASIGANLEEASAARTRADFTNKCCISLKEARETLYWLRLIEATGKAQSGEASTLRDEADQLVSILTTIVKNSRENKSSEQKERCEGLRSV